MLPWHVPEKAWSTNDFDEALTALFGGGVPVRGLSPATISRLKSVWQADYEAFCGARLARWP